MRWMSVPERVPKHVQHQVLALYLGGLGQRQVAERLGISQSTVSLEVKRFMDEAGRSLEEACKRYGIAELLRSTHYVSRSISEAGLIIPQCIKAVGLIKRLEDLGRGLGDLDDLFQLYDRALKDPAILNAGIRLMKMESEAERTYPELLRDHEAKTAEVKDLSSKIEELMKARAVAEAKLKDAQDRLSSITRELESATTAKERLAKLGLDKVNRLAEFIEGYEALNFSAEGVQRLAEWRVSLEEMDVNPDKLGQYIKERGSLEKQLASLRREKVAGEKKVKELRGNHLRLWNQVNTLKEEASSLSTLAIVLKEGKILMTCKLCGAPMSVFMKVPSRKEIETMVKSGLVMYAACVRCGGRPSYTAYDILAEVGWLALPV